MRNVSYGKASLPTGNPHCSLEQSDILESAEESLQQGTCLQEVPAGLAALLLGVRALLLYLVKIMLLTEAKIHRWERKNDSSLFMRKDYSVTQHTIEPSSFTTLTSFISCWNSCFRKALSWETDSACRPNIAQDITSTSACYSALLQL